MRIILSNVLALSILACTAVPLPKPIYLSQQSLSGISKVAIIASMSVPDVTYSRGSRGLIGIPMLDMMLAASDSSADEEREKIIKKHIGRQRIGDTLAESFMQPIKKNGSIPSIEHLRNIRTPASQLRSDGFDAIITLHVSEVSFKRIPGDYVRLFVNVQGKLESLKSGTILWDRSEYVVSSDSRSFDYYKSGGLQDLITLLERAGKNMAYDFVYLK